MREPCYVYAIAHPTLPLPADVAGVGGPLRMVARHDLAAIVSTLTEGRVEPSPENLLRHEKVVEALYAMPALLPARFGTVLDDDEAVGRALAERHDTLVADLERLRNTVEFGVTLLWQPGQAPPSPVAVGGGASRAAAPDATGQRGTAYLRARLAEHQRTEAAHALARERASDLEALVRPFVRASRRRLQPSPGIALRDVYLVPMGQSAGFRAAVEETRRRHQDMRLLLSGPWPPYSFVTPARDPS